MAELRAVPTRASRLPSVEEAEGWVGWRIDDINGSAVGQVERLCRDERGCPAWLVVGEDHLDGRRRFAVPAADAVGCVGRVWSPHTRHQIRGARIDGAEIAAADEPRLLAHYAAERRAA